MFEALSSKLNGVFDRLRRRGALSEEDVAGGAARSARGAARSRRRPAGGQGLHRPGRASAPSARRCIKSVTPGQQVVKIVHDALVDMLGGGEGDTGADLDLDAAAGADPDGRPAGLGQDHHLRQARAAAARSERKRRCCWPRSTPAARPRRSSWRRWRSRSASTACRSSPARRRCTSPQRAMDRGRRERLRRRHPRHRRPPARSTRR